MSTSVTDEDVLKGLVREAVAKEMLAEGQGVWGAFRLEDVPEDVRETLFRMKLDSEEHLQRFLRLAEELGADVDPAEMEAEGTVSGLPEEATVREVLERLLRHDRSCREFYRRAAAIRGSDLDLDTERAAEIFEHVAEDEKAHVAEVERLLEKPSTRLDGRLI